MKVIRTFVAILITDDLRRNISEVQARLKKLAPDVKWVAPKNFHVTLKFLGNILEDDLPDVYDAVEEAAKMLAPFDLSLEGLGAFPSPLKAKVVWVGIKDGRDKLIALASAVENNLADLGYEKEDRPFAAHITIGRVRQSKFLAKLAEGIDKVDSDDLGTQQVLSVAVMQSEILREGPIYSPLKLIKLSGGE